MNNSNALIAGATGLVGKHLLGLLLESGAYDKVYILSRRPLEIDHPKAVEIILDFDDLLEPNSNINLPEVQDVYCCLGTTMKKAGSKEAFRKVDYSYPLALAKKAAKAGALQYLLVSAMGAKKESYFFYNRVKGEVEEDISKVSAFKSVSIFRPSLILGTRGEHRRGEGVAKIFMRMIKPLMVGPMRKYRPIHAHTIAKGMLNVARQQERGVRVIESEDIKPLAGEMVISKS